MSRTEPSEIPPPVQAIIAAVEDGDSAACIATVSARIMRLPPRRPRPPGRRTFETRIIVPPYGRSRVFRLTEDHLRVLGEIAGRLEGARK